MGTVVFFRAPLKNSAQSDPVRPTASTAALVTPRPRTVQTQYLGSIFCTMPRVPVSFAPFVCRSGEAHRGCSRTQNVALMPLNLSAQQARTETNS